MRKYVKIKVIAIFAPKTPLFHKTNNKTITSPFFLICHIKIRFKSILHCFYKNKNTKNIWLFWLFCLCYCFWTGQKRVFWNPLRESTDHCLNQPPSTIHIQTEQTEQTKQKTAKILSFLSDLHTILKVIFFEFDTKVCKSSN